MIVDIRNEYIKSAIDCHIALQEKLVLEKIANGEKWISFQKDPFVNVVTTINLDDVDKDLIIQSLAKKLLNFLKTA